MLEQSDAPLKQKPMNGLNHVDQFKNVSSNQKIRKVIFYLINNT